MINTLNLNGGEVVEFREGIERVFLFSVNFETKFEKSSSKFLYSEQRYG